METPATVLAVFMESRSRSGRVAGGALVGDKTPTKINLGAARELPGTVERPTTR